MSDVDCDVETLSVDDVREVIRDATPEKLAYASQMAELTRICELLTMLRKPADQTSQQNHNFSLRINKRCSIQHQPRRSRRRARSLPSKHAITNTLPWYRPRWIRSMVCNASHGLQVCLSTKEIPTKLMIQSYATILLCRPARSISGQEQTQNWGNTTKAFTAANEVTRLIEDILTVSIGTQCQIHT
jgi:hypothetical protein